MNTRPIRKSAIDLLVQSAPLRLPVPPDAAKEFWGIMFRYTRGSNMLLRMMFETFGPDTLVRFLTRFHGMSVAVHPKSYWDAKFRDIHIYMAMRTISKVNDPAKWRRAVIRLGRLYSMTPKNVVRLFKNVKDSNRKEEGDDVFEKTLESFVW